MNGPAALVPALLFCTLSPGGALTCRTADGSLVELRDGARRLGTPASRGIVRVGAGGFCHLEAPAGNLTCFDGSGVLLPLRDPSVRATLLVPSRGVAADATRACGTEASGRTRCFLTATGEELQFVDDGRDATIDGWTRFALGDGFLCGRGDSDVVRCFALPDAATTRGVRVKLLSDAGRAYDVPTLAGADFRVEGRNVCVASADDGGLLCFDATGKRIALKSSTGFAVAPPARGGLALSPTHACAWDADGAVACHALTSGARVEFKNALGFADAPPAVEGVLLGPSGEACFLPRAGASARTTPTARASAGAGVSAGAGAPTAAPVCYVDGARVTFTGAAGHPVDASASALVRPELRAGRLCGLLPGGSLACFTLATGKAVTFSDDGGFGRPLDAARGAAFGANALCAVDASRQARCARYGGEAVAFRNGLGGKTRVEDVEVVRVAE